MVNYRYCTFGIFAHANAGKTTVTENILYEANIIKNIGRVDKGNTVTDSLEVEKCRGITVKSSVVSFDIGSNRYFLIDTPGHVDFSSEVERAINILDGAILVVSAVEGIEAQTYSIYEALKKKQIPIMVFINKADRKNANCDETIKSLRERLNMRLVALNNINYKKNLLEVSDNEIDTLMDQLSMYDELLVDKYLDGDITKNEVLNRIFDLSKKGEISVAICGSALQQVGTKQLYRAIPNCLSSYKDANLPKFSGYVYMTRYEKNNFKTYIKILSGRINVRDNVDIEGEDTQKVTALQKPKGTNYVNADFATPGQIVVCSGLKVKPGQLIGESNNKLGYMSFVNPKLNIQVIPVDSSMIFKLYNALKIMELEDPYLNVRISKNRKKNIFISLMGEVQIQIIQGELKERFNIPVKLTHATIIYKETPTVEGMGEASYTKVSKIQFKIYPMPEGSGLRFKSALSTDYLLRKYQRQAERLVFQYIKQGVYGWEVTDALIVLTNGRFDSMGSEPKHFNIAVPLALMRALKNCKNKLLQPISEYYLTIPSEAIKDVTKELSYRNAFYEIIYEDIEKVILHGEIPTEEINNFPVVLNKLTSGRGLFSGTIKKYTYSKKQNILNDYFGFDPRNEVKFVISEMGGDLNNLDVAVSKKRKSSRSKFKWKSQKSHP